MRSWKTPVGQATLDNPRCPVFAGLAGMIACPFSRCKAVGQSLSGFDRIKAVALAFVLTRFLHANRYPLRSKTL
jgi:hypothetical protein